MTKPRLLDLFCGAGGAAMGYHQAGFDVVGVDIKPQPNYPFEFYQADALDLLRHFEGCGSGPCMAYLWRKQFDAIHASPPCQRYSAAAEIHDSSERHPDLLPATVTALASQGLPWVIENVQRAPMPNAVTLCGSMFGLGVRRHRMFASNHLLMVPTCGSHSRWYASVFGGRCIGRQRVTGADSGAGSRTQTWDRFDDELATGREAMGIGWMDLNELSEAIPPAYTEFIGARLLNAIAAPSTRETNNDTD